MFRKSMLPAAAAIALALPFVSVSQTATAMPVTLEYNGGAAPYSTARIKSAPVAPIGSYVYSGGFDMTDQSGLLDDFIAWCLDLTHFLGVSGPEGYVITDAPFSNSFGADAAAQDRIQTYFDANYSETVALTSGQSGAFQLGLWEVLYDSDFTLAQDGARSDEFAATSHVAGIAEGFLDAAESYTGVQRWDLLFLESTGTGADQRQNLVTAVEIAELGNVAPVPLPAAGLFLLGGLAGLTVLARRRKTRL